jgi:hypothetical protein
LSPGYQITIKQKFWYRITIKQKARALLTPLTVSKIDQSRAEGVKVKNPAAPAVKREAEEDWGR